MFKFRLVQTSEAVVSEGCVPEEALQCPSMDHLYSTSDHCLIVFRLGSPKWCLSIEPCQSMVWYVKRYTGDARLWHWDFGCCEMARTCSWVWIPRSWNEVALFQFEFVAATALMQVKKCACHCNLTSNAIIESTKYKDVINAWWTARNRQKIKRMKNRTNYGLFTTLLRRTQNVTIPNKYLPHFLIL